MAAKNAGYADAEIGFALEYYKNHGITSLFVDRGQAGQPPITRRDQVQPANFGGQDFVLFTMSKEGAELLRDARYAKRHGFDSVDAYRDDFNNSLSDTVGRAGTKVLEFEQARDKFLGLDDAPILGPLARGKYDAISELTLAGSNFAQFIQSFEHFFVRISDDEELMRYYSNISARAEQTFTEQRRTYPQQENGLGNEILRGATASAPKVLSGPAVIYYDMALYANQPLDTAVAMTAIDGGSFVAAGAPGRLATGASRLASKRLAKLVDDKFVQETVQRVVARGTAGVANATASVGITASLEPARTDPEWASMTDAQKAEATKQAYARNAFRAFVLGLLMPGTHREQDFVTLSKPGTQLEGPLVRMPSPEGGTRYYGVAKVTDGSNTRMKMIEVDPSSPKARQLIEAGRVQDAQQRDVLAVLQERYQRLPPEAQAKLIEDANYSARARTPADAENGLLGNGSAGASARVAVEGVGDAQGGSAKMVLVVRGVAPNEAAGSLLNGAGEGRVNGLKGKNDNEHVHGFVVDPSSPFAEDAIAKAVSYANRGANLEKNGSATHLDDGGNVLVYRVPESSLERTQRHVDAGGEFSLAVRIPPGTKPIASLPAVSARQPSQWLEILSRVASADEPTAPKAALPPEKATGVPDRGDPPKAGEPKSAREQYVAMKGRQWSALEVAQEVAEEVESYAMNSRGTAEDRGLVQPFGTCTRAALDTSIKLSQRGVTHDLVVYDVVGLDGVPQNRHVVVELPGGEVVTYGRVYKSLAYFEKRHGILCAEVFRGDPKQYIARQLDETQTSTGIVSYPHQYTLEEMIEAQTKSRMVPFERGKVPSGSRVQYRGEEFTLVQYDEATGKPILFQKGRGNDRLKPEDLVALGFPVGFGRYDNVTEAELKAKYDEIVVNGETRWIDRKNRANVYSAADMGNGTFLVGPDWQYILWDETREPGALRVWAPKS
jgi:hypothetical protein